MESLGDALYRLRLAEGFLAEAEQDYQLKRWRAVVDNSQLAAENAAKAALALVLPPSRVHDPGRLLMEALAQGHFRGDQTETASTRNEDSMATRPPSASDEQFAYDLFISYSVSVTLLSPTG